VFAVALFFVVAFSSFPAYAQRPGKALVFAQIAFGGGYETVANLTNRGTMAYTGTLTLRASDPTKPFPALVNGSPLAAGMGLNLALDAGATATFRITSGDASAGTVSGFATIFPGNGVSDTLLEGNLTYYVKSADGTIVDSVGVAPSTPVPQAVIPFDDFQTVALALANTSPQTTTIRLTVFDDKNVQVGAAAQTLASNQQVPKFLFQYFPGVSLTRGRVEIQSDFFFVGTALTFVKGSQASSLPFLPSWNLYDITGSILGEQFAVRFYLALDGLSAKAYAVDIQNGAPVPGSFTDFTGIWQSGELVMIEREGSNEVCYTRIPAFSPSKATQSGKIVCVGEDLPGTVVQGTLTVRAIN
jgi:hypothetical protein